jgi:hypothetical protein
MRLLALAAVVAAAPSLAWADDDMFVSAGGTIGIGTTVDGMNHVGGDYEPEGTLGARLVLSWEDPRLAYKEPRGYRWRGSFVPEVIAGVLYVNDRRTGDREDNSDGFLMVGARADLAFSQRRAAASSSSRRAAASTWRPAPVSSPTPPTRRSSSSLVASTCGCPIAPSSASSSARSASSANSTPRSRCRAPVCRGATATASTCRCT